MNQKKLSVILLIGSVVFAIIAPVLLIFGLVFDFNSAITRFLVIFASILCFALVAEGLYLYFLIRDAKPNYFLYNYQTKRNISLQKLTPQWISNRMNRFLSDYATSEDKIWTDQVLDNPYLEIRDEFKPLVAYKLLLDLAEYDKEEGWKCFDLATNETVEYIVAALRSNGETNLADALLQIKTTNPVNLTHLRNFLIGNRKYLQGKMYRYVCANIQKF